MSSDTPIWISAAAASAASIVALFGPGVRRWWARPRMTLHQPVDTLLPTDELILACGDEEASQRMQFATLEVTNHGRSQLNDVEAVLTAQQRFGPIPPAQGESGDEVPAFAVSVVSRGLLQFELADPDRPRVTIPPGATRVLRLAYLATDERARRELERRQEEIPRNTVRISGGFALWPLAGADRMPWLVDNDETAVEIALSASNARPSTWRASIRAWYWSGMRDEDVDLSGIKLDWERDLHRVRHRPPPTRRRAWIARHTPWALWREQRFRREMRQIRPSQSPADKSDDV